MPTPPPNSITVAGGEGPKLPPIRPLDGTPDPELARALAEGAMRYHLDTLRELDEESRRTPDAQTAPSTLIGDPGPSPHVASNCRARRAKTTQGGRR